ncbi:MAG: hypothetical protein MRY63_00870 [Neomegalonema sp.]|nr:hypothetical protein [Neomegalonema sp.]
MFRLIIAIALAGGLGSVADFALGSEFFGSDILSDNDHLLKRLGINMSGAVALPVIFFILRGLFSYIVSMALLAGGAAVAAKLYFGVEQDWVPLLTQTLVYGLIATTLYRVLIPSR